MTSTIKTIGVVGTGVIGSSWITLFLAKGYKVIVNDPAPNAEQKLQTFIDQAWHTMERIGLAANASKSAVQFVENVADHLNEVDFVQENAPETKAFKIKLMAELDSKAPPHVVIASSSSGIPASEFIENCQKAPERILIGHPFNPPHLIPLVEVVPHPGTAQKSIDEAMDFYTCLGKQPILVKAEVPGFVANRLQAALNHEAMSLVYRGIVSAEDVDKAVTSSLGLRWSITGPLMCNILGAGGDAGAFLKMNKTIGRAAGVWIDDMKKHEFVDSDENLATVDSSVQEWLGHVDLSRIQRERDEVVLGILAEKARSMA